MTDPIPTTERLTAALVAAGAPPEMIFRSKEGGYYVASGDDRSPDLQLMEDLRQAGLESLETRVLEGEFDAPIV